MIKSLQSLSFHLEKTYKKQFIKILQKNASRNLSTLIFPNLIEKDTFHSFSKFSMKEKKTAMKRHSSTFTSKHFQLRPVEIQEFLRSNEVSYKDSATGFTIKYCPLCPRPHKNIITNLYTLNIEGRSGVFHCFRCGAKGTWHDFKASFLPDTLELDSLSDPTLHIALNTDTDPFQHPSLNSHSLPDTPSSTTISSTPGFDSPYESHSQLITQLTFSAYQKYQALNNAVYKEVNQYLTSKEGRFISQEVLKIYKVGAGVEKFRNDLNQYIHYQVVYFPMYGKAFFQLPQAEDATVQIQEACEEMLKGCAEGWGINKIKCRAIGKTNKHRQRVHPTGAKHWGLFGFNTLPSDAKAIVITEGEFDAMAVYQETGIGAISLPNGANHLPLEVLPWLEKYDRIYLWMDSDEVGRTAAEKFAHKLGIKRTFIVNCLKDDAQGPKDANDALKQGRDVQKYIRESRPLVQENIQTFRDLRENVIKRLLNYEENKGINSDSFSWFNSKIKGFRKGEMTVLTGSTGAGKTTFLSQLSLDFLLSGVPTLWGSFEVKNDILASTMLLQYAKKNLIEDSESINLFANDFEALPLYFLKLFGSTDVEALLNTLDYAVYAFDIAHIVIDNLQFLLSGQGKGFERFDIQDALISKLRHFSIDKNVHITLVIHPKKIDEDVQDLSISSVFGSPKATQEADNVFIIQNRHKYRHLDIRKNRFDGETGRVGLGYQRDIKRFFELTDSEIFDLNTSNKTIDSVIQNRMNKYGRVEVIQEIENAPQSPTLKKNEKQFEFQKERIERIVDEDLKHYEKFQNPIPQKENSNIGKKKIVEERNEIQEKNTNMRKVNGDVLHSEELLEPNLKAIDETLEFTEEMTKQEANELNLEREATHTEQIEAQIKAKTKEDEEQPTQNEAQTSKSLSSSDDSKTELHKNNPEPTLSQTSISSHNVESSEDSFPNLHTPHTYNTEKKGSLEGSVEEKNGALNSNSINTENESYDKKWSRIEEIGYPIWDSGEDKIQTFYSPEQKKKVQDTCKKEQYRLQQINGTGSRIKNTPFGKEKDKNGTNLRKSPDGFNYYESSQQLPTGKKKLELLLQNAGFNTKSKSNNKGKTSSSSSSNTSNTESDK